MKCKCKNEMRDAGSHTQEYDYTIETTHYYWCGKCGRLYSTDCGWHFSDPDILPKPLKVTRDHKDWCNCKKWKKTSRIFKINSDQEFCRYCGKELHKTELVEVEI